MKVAQLDAVSAVKITTPRRRCSSGAHGIRTRKYQHPSYQIKTTIPNTPSGLREPCQEPLVAIASGSAPTNPSAPPEERRAIRILDQSEAYLLWRVTGGGGSSRPAASPCFLGSWPCSSCGKLESGPVHALVCAWGLWCLWVRARCLQAQKQKPWAGRPAPAGSLSRRTRMRTLPW